MIDALRFVQGAVARKDFVPEMTHFHIKEGGVMTYNGALTLYSPIELNFDVSPKADQMVKAIAACQDQTITLHMTPAKKLSVKSGRFKALIDCLPLSEPLKVDTDGVRIYPGCKLLPILKTLLPFIAEDASRPWARGILFRGNSVYATNNVILIEHFNEGFFSTPVNIPKSAVAELLRINEEPETVTIGESAVTFTFSEGRWLKAQVYSTDWPDVSGLLDRIPASLGPAEVNPLLWEGVEQLLPFADKEFGSLYVTPTSLSTLPDDDGAVVSIDNSKITDKEAVFNAQQFHRLRGVAKYLDLRNHPAPCKFSGDYLRGAIVGMRPGVGK